MPCKYYDCGWCYAPEDLETTAEASQCNRMEDCPQSISWKDINLPPINLRNSQKALDFYKDVPDANDKNL